MTVNELTIRDYYEPDDIKMLSHCTLCPRECRTDRFKGSTGYCRSDAGTNIASICIHRGEEPSISGPDGICNIFFSGCNLRCAFCQNHEISRKEESWGKRVFGFKEALEIITGMLDQGIRAVGFVSPSHVVPQVRAIIKALHIRGYKPIMIYNTNTYDKKETITRLNGIIDVYLPDYKYTSSEIAEEFSDASDYPEIALKAIKEMYYQKGSVLMTDNEGRAENGMLIRHLIMPGHTCESIKVLRSIADEISTGVSISLMSQYHPTELVKDHPVLGRSLYTTEYEVVATEMDSLGFRNGWIQDIESHNNYRPDFNWEHPFEY